jgi:signal peptidase I
VKVQGGFVYINDQKIDEPYLQDQTILFPGSYLTDGVDITVGPDQYFVFGDNRPHSSDSREFGPIEKNTIIGRAIIRYWPPAVAGMLPVITYNF